MSDQDSLSLDGSLPDSFLVSVIMERRPSASPWADFSWNAIGVVATHAGNRQPVKVFDDGAVAHFQHFGFMVELHKDECESYYHNLMMPHPRCFVIAELDDSGVPRPFKVSMSFDEANAYTEGDSQVYPVDIPPELYRWCEAYVLQHYVPVKKTKRKLVDWRETPGPTRH